MTKKAPKPNRKRGPRRPHLKNVDVYIGQRLRELRIERGLTQIALAEVANLSHQQIQKYEVGSNSIAAARLVELAEHLQVPIAELLPEDGINVIISPTIHGGRHRPMLTNFKLYEALPDHMQDAVHTIIHTLHAAYVTSIDLGQAA